MVNVNNCKYSCDKCLYFTDIRQSFDRHNKTKTHKQKENNEFQVNFECKNCNKTYTSNVGLWKHKKYCKKSIKIEKPLNKNILLEFIEKQNNELVEIKNIIKEMKEAITELKVNR